MRGSLPIAGLVSVLLLSCSSDPTITSPVAQVSLDAAQAQTAEIQFLQSVRNAECRYDRLTSLQTGGPSNINVLTACGSPDMKDNVFTTRKHLMNAIVEYAQALSTVGGVSTDQFDTNVKSAAAQFSADAKAGNFLAAFTNQFSAGAVVTSALGQIMDWIVAYYRKEDVTTMAKSNQANLNTVLDLLKQENTLVAQRAFDEAQGAAVSVKIMQSNPQMATKIAAALTIDQTFWQGGPSTGTGDTQAMGIQYPSASAANDALDQLQFCHDLVAAGGTLKGNKCKLSPATLKTSATSGSEK